MTRCKLVCVTVCIVLFFCSPFPLHAEEESSQINSCIGVDYQPKVTWSFPSWLNYNSTNELKYKMDASSYTTYQTNVQIKKIQATLGLNAVVADNSPSGKVDRYSGYLGIKNLFASYSLGKIKGSAVWSGALAKPGLNTPGMTTDFAYDTSVKSYALNYMFKGSGEMGMYAGIGYTSMDVPIQINTLTTPGGRANQVYGVSVYDKNFKVSSYNIDFGFDTMLGKMASGKIIPGEVSFYGHGEDTLGFGNGTISDAAAANAIALNQVNGVDRQFANKKGFIAYLQNDTTLGFFWAPSPLKGHCVLALGYNIAFSTVFTFSGAADNANELGYDASFGMFRHGPMFRAYATW